MWPFNPNKATAPPRHYRLSKQEVSFLGYALKLSAAEALPDNKKRYWAFERAHVGIFHQVPETLDYPSQDAEKNLLDITLSDRQQEIAGWALDYLVELAEQGQPKTVADSGVVKNRLAKASLHHANVVTDDLGRDAHALQERLGLIPKEQ